MYKQQVLVLEMWGIHTIQARVVIIDGFDNTAEVELDVLLNQSRVKWTKVATLVIHTVRHNSQHYN